MRDNKPQGVVTLEGQGSRAGAEPSGVVTRSYTRELSEAHASARALSLFRDLPESDLHALSGATRVLELQRDAYVFHTGDAGSSLYVVLQGVVEIVVERETGDPLRLATCEAGEFFGETALVNAEPRSASARALCDCKLLLIDREGVIRAGGPQLAARLLAELGKRLGRADGTLAHLADRVSRAAYANVNGAVAGELEAIKTLHRHTEQLAANTLMRAEERATEVMARADATMSQVRGQLDSAWSLLKRRIVPLGLVLVVACAWLGVNALRGVRSRLSELQRMDEQIKGKSQALASMLATSQADATRLRSAYARTRALEETVGELRAIRESVGLDRELDTPEQLRRAALNYEDAKRQVRSRYLARTQDGPQWERYQAGVIFEAVDTFVTLNQAGTDDGQLSLAPEERSDVLGALVYTLANMGDLGDPALPGHAQLLSDRRVRDMLVFVAAGADAAQKRELTNALGEALATANVKRTRENLALSLAELGERTVQSLNVLTDMQHSRRPWRAAFGALALAKLGMKRGLDGLTEALQQRETAYPAASLLAELGVSGLSALVTRVGTLEQLPALRTDIERVLRTYEPRNCLEERYARHLLTCLQGPCATLSNDESCPSYSARN